VDEQRASARHDDPTLARRLTRALEGPVAFDIFTRGRYATDASIYQIMPAGVVFPKSSSDLEASLKIAGECGVSVTLRGAGTSQNGQPLGTGLIVDCSRYLNAVQAYDPSRSEIQVEPGVVLQQLNARLRDDGLFFPVEPSTASRCTLGGMTGNNSCGARSLRYGKMVDNVLGISALLADGQSIEFAAPAEGHAAVSGGARAPDLARRRSLAPLRRGLSRAPGGDADLPERDAGRRRGSRPGADLDRPACPGPPDHRLCPGPDGVRRRRRDGRRAPGRGPGKRRADVRSARGL